MMSTGGITRLLFFEGDDQNVSFDTQDALDSLLEEIKEELKRGGDGGDTTSEDDEWIAETITIPDQVSVSPDHVVDSL